MVFDKLANVITKHYKKVLIAWIVILIVSVPAILKVSEVMSYNSTGVTVGDYESVKAAVDPGARKWRCAGQDTVLHSA